MDYEKAYKEALERAKKQHSRTIIANLPGDREKIEEIFPELKESEDELMRKEAISIIKQYNIICEKEGDKCYTADRVIAWLEKQGHDGKKWIYEDVYIKEKEQSIQDGIDEVLENPQKYGLEKQGEKSWSEEDKNMLLSIINDAEQDALLDKEQINWLKSLKPRWKPSEEQMQALFEAKLASTKNREYFLGLLYEDLKKL